MSQLRRRQLLVVAGACLRRRFLGMRKQENKGPPHRISRRAFRSGQVATLIRRHSFRECASLAM